MNKIFYILTTAILSGNYLFAQPANDDICSATPINPTGGGACIAGETNVAATSDFYGGCVPPGNSSVWYTFQLTGGHNMVEFTFSNTVIPTFDLFLLDNTCGNPNGVSTVCDVSTALFQFFNLTTGVDYFILVSTDTANEGAFDICVNGATKNSVTGPEQDCLGAIPVCDSTYTQSISYTDFGAVQDISGTCLLANETNSVWYVFTVQADGSLEFLINTAKDYDFALYDITTIGCAGVPGATPDRCNWSGTKGNTGLVLPTSATIPLSEPATGPNTMPGMDITAGQTFALLVDNWTGDATGYTLDFGSSPIVDTTKPFMVSAAGSCTDNAILVTMSEAVQCLSIVQNSFTLNNTTTSEDFTDSVTGIVGYNCPITDGATTTQIEISHNGSLTAGTYEICAYPPTAEDQCENQIDSADCVTYTYFPLLTLTFTSDVSVICTSGDPVTLTVTVAPAGSYTYTLTPGPVSNGTGVFAVNPATTTTYTVSVTSGTCTFTKSLTITLENNVVVSIDPVDPQVCPAGTVTLTATTTINGLPCIGCTFSWTPGGETTASINKGAGTYTVTSTTTNGCVSNTASSTVTEATAGAGVSCNVWYVSTGGGGDGQTKATPTDLVTALANALCTSASIKMQGGTYAISDFIAVDSYITIEGGYDAAFDIKSSDMAAGTATTIQRSLTADSDQALRCTAFRVTTGSSGFRFQDLRIEFTGAAHAAGSQISNYGIYLESGCSGYDIVRCYIGAGTGADE